MMKKYLPIIISIFLFTLNNTSYFWVRSGFILGTIFTIINLIGFLLLTILILFQIYYIYKEKVIRKKRILNLLFLIFTLVYCLNFPDVIDFDTRINGKPIFHAYYEGSANCTTSIILRENQRFTSRSICFGIIEGHGNYKIVNDSIFMRYDEGSKKIKGIEIAVIKRDSIKSKNIPSSLLLLRDNDTLNRHLRLKITKNELN